MAQVWLITGSSRGLGRHIAMAALDAGYSVVATARNSGDLEDLVTRFGERALAISLDVTDAQAAQRAVDAAVSTFGRLDVVVNNAGYANVNSIEDVGEDDFRAQIETNFFGVVNVTRAALPVMRRQHSGHIIQISSIGGRTASPGLGAYQSAKWAVGGFSEVLAKEVAPLGIHVTVIEPGGMRTDWAGPSMRIDEIAPDYLPTVGAMLQMRENPHIFRGDPAKIAQVILQIAAESAPPVRLIIGSDAVVVAERMAAERAREDAQWHDLSMSTDFDGMPPFAETPVGRLMLGASE
jgi:NAD(P)-dependent dehydrogenase (short-subunit alcohol dehydrogenase family)